MERVTIIDPLYFSDAATPWWKGRGDFDYSQPPKRTAEGSCEEAESSSSGAGSTLGSMELDHHKSEKKAARFTEYSMTSSKVPRSEGMSTKKNFPHGL